MAVFCRCCRAETRHMFKVPEVLDDFRITCTAAAGDNAAVSAPLLLLFVA
jgi:hypothetical protein